MIQRSEIEPELFRYLVSQGPFEESFINKLREQVYGAPEIEVFTMPIPYEAAPINPSKRSKAPLRKSVVHPPAWAGPSQQPTPMIRDERPIPIIRHKEAKSTLRHPGVMWVIAGGPPLHWNSETGNWWMGDDEPGNTHRSGNHRISIGYFAAIKELIDEGTDLDDIPSEVYHALRSKGYDVPAVFVSTGEMEPDPERPAPLPSNTKDAGHKRAAEQDSPADLTYYNAAQKSGTPLNQKEM